MSPKSKFDINVDAIAEKVKVVPKDDNINIRIEGDVKKAFIEMCTKEYGVDYSAVLRQLMIEACQQKGYMK